MLFTGRRVLGEDVGDVDSMVARFYLASHAAFERYGASADEWRFHLLRRDRREARRFEFIYATARLGTA